MKNMLLKSLIGATVGSLMMVGSSFALPVLTLTAGGDIQIIDDSTDTTPSDGNVTFTGPLGDTTVTVSFGSSAPASGDFDYPNLHLAGIVNGGTDLVTFHLTDTFTSINAGILSWVTEFGGAGNAPSSLAVEINGTEIANFSVFGPDQFSSFVPERGPYVFDLTGTIQANANTTSFDADVSPVPEPTTMLLFGTGLIGLAGISRRRKSKK